MEALKKTYFDVTDLTFMDDQKTKALENDLKLDEEITTAMLDSLGEELVHLDMNMKVLLD